MFERLKKLYIESKIDQAGLEKAVQNGWITEEEMNLILEEHPINEEEIVVEEE